MADRYARSTDGSDADNGTTWALAKATAAGLAAIDAAGDRLFFSQSHSESTAGAVTLSFAGTLATPSQILCGNDAAEPPTALATSAQIKTSAGDLIINGSHYCYGIQFTAGQGSAASSYLKLSNDVGHERQVYDNCQLITGTTSNSGGIYVGAAGGGKIGAIELVNTGIKFGQDTHGINVWTPLTIRGGSILASSVVPDQGFIISNGAGNGDAQVDGFDFTNMPAGGFLANVANTRVTFRNCKLPNSWTGSLVKSTATLQPNGRVEMFNCDNADTNYRLWIEDYCGSIKHETTLVKTGGASDGTTPLSWKMVSSANAEYPALSLRSPEIFSEPITSVGSAKTITVDILRDSATNLKDDEIWLEVQYLGTSGRPLSSFAVDAKASVLAAAADQTASSATWTTTGMTNPNKQKLEVTFTPQEAGVAIVTVCMAKASTTVYIDPVAQVS